jgi:hypothetical protein
MYEIRCETAKQTSTVSPTWSRLTRADIQCLSCYLNGKSAELFKLRTNENRLCKFG